VGKATKNFRERKEKDRKRKERANHKVIFKIYFDPKRTPREVFPQKAFRSLGSIATRSKGLDVKGRKFEKKENR